VGRFAAQTGRALDAGRQSGCDAALEGGAQNYAGDCFFDAGNGPERVEKMAQGGGIAGPDFEQDALLSGNNIKLFNLGKY
jgi:hypothetical protein